MERIYSVADILYRKMDLRRIQKSTLRFVSLLIVFVYLSGCDNKRDPLRQEGGNVALYYWLTTGDKSSLLVKTDQGLTFGDAVLNMPVIDVDTTERYQSIDGFGYAMTGGSAYLINQTLTPAAREALLKELFLWDGDNIGISYLRISIGASDLDDHVFSYNDLPAGKTDVTLKGFSLDEDRKNLIPVLKQILVLNPEIKIMGSPWSAPAWMKTNGSPKGGSLKPAYYGAYADYFVRYIQDMAKEGIPIDAITLQNEPENPKNNPSMLMTAAEQALFVKRHLGPAFEKAGIKTKIVVFDHNCDHPNYPIEVLNDAEAKRYIDGSAFHLYLGEIEVLSDVHKAHPDRHLYFTEQWTSPQGTFDGDLRWHTRQLIIGSTRHWSRNVLEWNLAADPEFNPHTDEGGCTTCQGALTISKDSVTRNVSYYIIAHASKFVRPGSVRIASTIVDNLYNVAFETPSGEKVLIVVNDNDEPKNFGIRNKGKTASAALPAGAVATFTWH
jgi:glucosylceramidase